MKETIYGSIMACGGRICTLRHNFLVYMILVFMILCLPMSIFINIFPEILDYIDAKEIIFLLPVLTNFVHWGLDAGCHFCLCFFVEAEQDRYGFSFTV
jgi:hypothetical protein